MSEKEITHTGRIVSIDADRTTVEIISESACTACAAAGMCTASESVRKIVNVGSTEGFQVGEEVDVCLGESMGLKAVAFSYVIPLAILLIIVVSLSYTSVGELFAGLAGLLAVGIYYLVLYFFRGKFAKEYNFYIRRK